MVEHVSKILDDAAAILERAHPDVIDRQNNGKEVKLDVDQELHRFISAGLIETGLPVLSEEADAPPESLANGWIIDPLDGSLNYLRGIPLCGISIARIVDGQPADAYIYDFSTKSKLIAVRGHGFLSPDSLAVSSTSSLSQAVLCTGFPSRMNYEENGLARYVRAIQKFCKIRMFGSALQSAIHVACGKADTYFEHDVMIWDVAAGLVLIEAAGGTWTMEQGSLPHSRIVLASNKVIHQAASDCLLSVS